MNTKTKKTLLILAIIVLVVINITAILTIIYTNRIKPPPPPIEENTLRQEIQARGMYRFLKEELNLSEEQFDEFQKINRKNMVESHDIISKLNNKRLEMMTEIAKENPNLETLDEIAYDIGTLHYELKKKTIDHFLELKGICNEGQQENLQRLFMNLLDNQEQFGRTPRERGRNRHGRQHGRN